MKKYTVYLTETFVKVATVMAYSEKEARRKADKIDWEEIENDTEDADISVTLDETMEDAEILMDIVRADEGWIISYDTLSNVYKIQKIDEDDRFFFDTQAIEHVVNKMLEGSNLHARAFKFAFKNANTDERVLLTEVMRKAIIE